MSISAHPDSPESPGMAAAPVAATAPAAPAAGTRIRSRLFTKYVALFVAVVGVALLSNGIFEVFFYYREHKAALIRIQHEQARGRRRQDRPVHQGNRKPARLDHPAAMVGRHARAAPVRRAAAAAPGAGDHRTRPGRRHRPRAAAGVAPGHGRGGQRDRPLGRAEIRRDRRAQGLLRAGLFPARIRALHDACRSPGPGATPASASPRSISS